MIKTGLGFGTSRNASKNQNKQNPKSPPWIPSGAVKGVFPPPQPVGHQKGSVQDVNTSKQLKQTPVNVSLPKPSTSAGIVGTSKSRRPLMLPDTICPTKPPQKSPQTPTHRVQKAQKVHSPTKLPLKPPKGQKEPIQKESSKGPSVPSATSGENQIREAPHLPRPSFQFQPPFQSRKGQTNATQMESSTRPSASSATSRVNQIREPPQPIPQKLPTSHHLTCKLVENMIISHHINTTFIVIYSF